MQGVRRSRRAGGCRADLWSRRRWVLRTRDAVDHLRRARARGRDERRARALGACRPAIRDVQPVRNGLVQEFSPVRVSVDRRGGRTLVENQ